MSGRYDKPDGQDLLRDKLIGLGNSSMRKSYYPELQKRLDDLERFRTLLNNCNEYIFLAAANDASLLDVSSSAEEQLGYAAEEFAGMSLYRLFPRSLLEPLLQEMEEGQNSCAEEKIMLVTELERGDSGILPVEISFRLVDFASQRYIVIVARDITERKRASDALREANEQLEYKVETRTQELMAVNEELRALNEELQHAFDQLSKMQDQLVEAEKLAALGGMVAGVAHEINTPVGLGVTLASHLVQLTEQAAEKLKLGELKRRELEEYFADCREAAQILLGNLNRTAGLVQSFKQVSADQVSEQRRSFNVLEYLEDILRSMHSRLKQTHHQIRLECEPEIVIDSYPGAFSQIVTNLIMNSLVHGYGEHEAGLITICFAKNSDKYELVYRDDGRGIAPEHLGRIFEPFFTGNRSGGNTGLGLNILYNIVRQIFKGSVECKSKPGEGVVFEIRFPAETAS